MTSRGRSNEPNDLSEAQLSDMLDAIARDHTVATEAGKTQGQQLQEMGRKAAEVYERSNLSWRQIAARTRVSVRTVRRYAEPYLTQE